MITVVFDTNIFISAFEFGGVPRDAFLWPSQRSGDALKGSVPLLNRLNGLPIAATRTITGFLNARSRLKQGTLSLGIAPFYA